MQWQSRSLNAGTIARQRGTALACALLGLVHSASHTTIRARGRRSEARRQRGHRQLRGPRQAGPVPRRAARRHGTAVRDDRDRQRLGRRLVGRGRGTARRPPRPQRLERRLRPRLQPGRRPRDLALPRLPQLRQRARGRLARGARRRRRRPTRGSALYRASCCMPDGTVNTAGNRVHFLGFSWAPAGADPGPATPTADIPVGLGRVPARAPLGVRGGRRVLGRASSCTARTPTSAGASASRATAS